MYYPGFAPSQNSCVNASFTELLGFTLIKHVYNYTNAYCFHLVCMFELRLYIPVNNFSVMSGRSHRFLGIASTFWEVNVSCSRIQHGDLNEDRTPDLLLRSPTLYH